ncbi:MAG: 50S ribosomal protein L30 [Candidatus Nanohaloarchaeota archaeon]|nr:50S ribosomal protein L30 [Candidatus Nanohaloarchaeota archaeon]
MAETYIAVVRVKGTVGVDKRIEETLKRLKLTKPNHVVFYKLTPSIEGMVKKVKDYVTWGEVEESFIKEVESKASKSKEDDNLYRLAPPRKGYGKKGIKHSYSKKGAVGYRGKDIKDLIVRMIHE